MLTRYQVISVKDRGCALFKFNKEAMMWQQVSKWYTRFSNLQRFVLYPLHIVVRTDQFYEHKGVYHFRCVDLS